MEAANAALAVGNAVEMDVVARVNPSRGAAKGFVAQCQESHHALAAVLSSHSGRPANAAIASRGRVRIARHALGLTAAVIVTPAPGVTANEPPTAVTTARTVGQATPELLRDRATRATGGPVRETPVVPGRNPPAIALAAHNVPKATNANVREVRALKVRALKVRALKARGATVTGHVGRPTS